MPSPMHGLLRGMRATGRLSSRVCRTQRLNLGLCPGPQPLPAPKHALRPVEAPGFCRKSTGVAEAVRTVDARADPELAGQSLNGGGPACPPTVMQLRMLGFASALPFVGFGFLDNFLMILFGDIIDGTLCVMFSFSTMAAAAIGNTISDAAGIFSGGFVEHLATKLGVEEPLLTREQRQLFVTKAWQYVGQVLGIVIGCTLGCCPLLWIDANEGARLKHEKEQRAIFQSTVSKVCTMLHAEAAALLLVDKEKNELYTTTVTPNLTDFRWSTDLGFMGHVATTGQFVNIAEAKEEALYKPELHDNLVGSGIQVQSLLCMPVWQNRQVTGLIILFNKSDGAFTTRDEDILSAICTHVSVALGDSKHNFEEVLDNCQMSMTQQCAPQWSTSTKQRRKTLYSPVLKGMGTYLGVESVSLLLLDDDHGEVYIEATENFFPAYRTRLGEGLAGRAVERGVVINVDSRSFNPEDKTQLEEMGMTARSALCVPIFDTSRKCVGALQCLNKDTDTAFSTEEVQYVSQVANYFALMLEGPTAELRRVLHLTRQNFQHKEALQSTEGQNKSTVICYLEQAHDLPVVEHAHNTGINPYVTFSILRGDPVAQEVHGLRERVLRNRSASARDHRRHYGKSQTVYQASNPEWHETIAVSRPAKLKNVNESDLYVHVLVWNYNSLHNDDIIGHTSFPLTEVKRAGTNRPRPFPLHPIEENHGCFNLEKARIWLSFSRGGAGQPNEESSRGSAPYVP